MVEWGGRWEETGMMRVACRPFRVRCVDWETFVRSGDDVPYVLRKSKCRYTVEFLRFFFFFFIAIVIYLFVLIFFSFFFSVPQPSSCLSDREEDEIYGLTTAKRRFPPAAAAAAAVRPPPVHLNTAIRQHGVQQP